MCYAVGMKRLALAVVLWQSAEQRCREVESADAASVARLVYVVLLLSRSPKHAVVVFPWACVCSGCVGVDRRVRVVEHCEVPRCATVGV